MSQKQIKHKRVINRWAVVLLSSILLIVISIFKIPSFRKQQALLKLGYDEVAIEAIKDRRLTNTIIDNAYYSDYLKQEISKDSFKVDYLELYLCRTNLTDDEFLLYDRLIAKGYTKEEVNTLFKELKYQYQLTPLLVFDKMTDLKTYIDDCKMNSDDDDQKHFKLKNNYLYPYQSVKPAINIGQADVLVTKKHDLGEYVPEKLVPLSYRYASDGVEIDNLAYEDFIALCDDMMEHDVPIYALNGYRSYERQSKIYSSYENPKEADENTFRPGFGESQTGLSLTVVDSEKEDLSEFGTSDAYKYLEENAHRFGFIIRYPEGKEYVTGYEGMPYQIRYVGKDLASAIHKSGLTFEEYYYLYLDDVKAPETK